MRRACFDTGDLLECQQIQTDLRQSMFDDFHKYAGRIDTLHLVNVLQSIPRQLGDKFKYVKADPAVQSRTLSRAPTLLEQAGLCHRIYRSAGDGVPLGARIRSNRFKAILFDTGLANRLLGADLRAWFVDPGLTIVNRGAIAEQLVGQELAAWLDATPPLRHRTPGSLATATCLTCSPERRSILPQEP